MSSSFQAVTTTRMYRKVADQIIQRIQQGYFAPGTRLPPERELSEQLKVSRASVREALIALELEGYVEVRGGVGVLVLSNRQAVQSLPGSVANESDQQSSCVTGKPADASAHETAMRPALQASPWSVQAAVPGASNAPVSSSGAVSIHNETSSGGFGPFDILETRLLLEPDAAALAAHVGLPDQIAAIARANDALFNSATPAEHDFAFHHAIAVASGNTALESAIVHVWQLSVASPVFTRLQQHFVTHHVWTLAYQEHLRILEAIRDRDPVQARHAMHDHLVGILARLRQDFGRSALF